MAEGLLKYIWPFLRVKRCSGKTFLEKLLGKHSWLSSYSAYLQTSKLANMLNTVYPHISVRPATNKPHPLISATSENLIRAGCSVTNVFLGIFSKIFRTALLKSNHILMQWVLLKKQIGYSIKDLIRSARSLVICKICKFKILVPPEVFDLVSSDTKNHPKLYYHYFSPTVSD